MPQILSIITINFNDKIGLEKTIRSVFEQTYKSFEFILIDGNSSDGSQEVLKLFDSKIDYWISEPDSGIYNAMNKGIIKASGDYLLFLNSGDILNGANALRTFIENENFEGDIIYGDYKFDKGGKVYPNILTPMQFFKSSLPHQSSLIKRSLFLDFGLYNENLKIVSDWEFFIKCFLSEKLKFKHINYPLSIYDLNGVSSSIKHKKLHLEEREYVLNKYFGLHYTAYQTLLKLQAENKSIKRKSIKGIFIRIKKKIQSLFI